MTTQVEAPVAPAPRRPPPKRALSRAELWRRRGPLLPALIFAIILTQVPFIPTAGALIWKTSIFNPTFGLLNWALSPFGVGNVDWTSQHPMLAIILVLTWQWTPFMMLIVLAGLQSQSPEILEAAKVDGARAF